MPKITVHDGDTTTIYEAARDMTATYPNLMPFPVNTNQWVKEVYKAYDTIAKVLVKGFELSKVDLILTPSNIDCDGLMSINLHLSKDGRSFIKAYELTFNNDGKFSHPEVKK